MAGKELDAWQRRRKKEVEEFTSGWSWGYVFQTWMGRLAGFSVSLHPLFSEVWVHDPKFPTGRETALSWWPAGNVRKLQIDLQRHLDRFPGTYGPIHPSAYYTRKGELETLNYLWEHREDTEKVAAILIAASLFSRLGSSRGRYPRDEWPPYHCVGVLSQWAYERWLGTGSASAWSRSCTEVLPAANEDYVYKLDSMLAIVRYLAEEHVLVLSKYKPVSIVFKPERDPFVEKVLREEREEERRLFDEWRRVQEQEKLDKRREEERRKKAHPRWGKWHRISNEELERLVWSMPTRTPAREFGVSDVAIAKRCKSAGIPKPPRGFWAEVEAGKIPHPQGKPPRRRDH